ncbi:MAG: TadE/TadG family type IV pilus assembly protein [Selenomonadaceae bacterium]|nr:TadE/TadG family type IV pilus assembly protein [Selenomonadaceae bacterium]
MMRKFQQGQSIVEFAMILPFLFLLLWGFIYFGLFFSDYLMLNSVARSCAREASLQSSADFTQLITTYTNKVKGKQVTNLYALKTLNIDTEVSQQDKKTKVKDVVVTIQEDIDSAGDNSKGLYQVFRNFIGDAVRPDFTITYRMYWEGNPDK